MAVNGSTDAGIKVWGEIVTVTPNTDYQFSAWISAINFRSQAQLNFSINGDVLGADIQPLDMSGPDASGNYTNPWKQFSVIWNSGSNTSADIRIIDGSLIYSGNDFGLDDISFSPVCTVYDNVVVTVTEPPCIITDVPTLSTEAVCENNDATVTLNLGTSNPLSIQWYENCGSGWSLLSEASAILTIPNTPLSKNGCQYQCIVGYSSDYVHDPSLPILQLLWLIHYGC